MNIEKYMNKSVEELRADYANLEVVRETFRESARLFLSRFLMDTDEDNPYECDIRLEPEGTFGLSSLEMPNLTAMWQYPAEGYIAFEIDGCELDFDSIGDEELIQIVNEISE